MASDEKIRTQDTVQFRRVREDLQTPEQILSFVYRSLREKGYDPISQIVGYILSEDPTYITTHNNARNLIRRVDRFELLQILLKEYVSSEG